MLILLILIGFNLIGADRAREEGLAQDLVEHFVGETTTKADAPQRLKKVLQDSLDQLIAKFSKFEGLHHELLVNGLSIFIDDQKDLKDFSKKSLLIEIEGKRVKRKDEEKMYSGIVIIPPKKFKKNMSKSVRAFFSEIKRDHSDLSKLLMISFFVNAEGSGSYTFERLVARRKGAGRFFSQIRGSY